jgi:hypothetical protein
MVRAAGGNLGPLAFLLRVMDESIAKLQQATATVEPPEEPPVPPSPPEEPPAPPAEEGGEDGDHTAPDASACETKPQKPALHAQFEELVTKLIDVEARRQELYEKDDEFKFKLVKMHASFLQQVRVTVFVGGAKSLAKSDCCCVLKWTASLAELESESAPTYKEAQNLGGENATFWVEKGKTQVNPSLLLIRLNSSHSPPPPAQVVGGKDPYWGETFQVMVSAATLRTSTLLVEVWRTPKSQRGSTDKLLGRQKVRQLGQVQVPAAWFMDLGDAEGALSWMALRPGKSQKRVDLATGAISIRATLQGVAGTTEGTGMGAAAALPPNPGPSA